MTQHRTKPRRWLRRGGLALALVFGAFAALVLSVGLAAQTTGGRRALAGWVLGRVNEELPGSLTIASIDAIGLSGARGRGLRILDASGRETLRADRFTAVLDLGRALQGEFVILSADVDGGRVVIEELPSGRVRLEDALSTAAGPRTPTARLEFRHVRFRHMQLVVEPAGAPAFRLRNLHGTLAIKKAPMGAVRMDFMNVGGALRAPGWNGQIGLAGVSGHIDGDARTMLDLHGSADVASDDSSAWHFTYGRHPEPWILLAFEPEGVASTLLSAQLHVFAAFSALLAME